MPPSAGACQTTDAALKPDCGRASNWSSIMTAIGWRAAAAGETRRPVSGAGTSLGAGVGVGSGGYDGGGETDGPTEGLASGDGLGPTTGPLDGGVLPSPATSPEPAGGVAPGDDASAANIPRPRPPRIARIPSARTAARFIERCAVRACGLSPSRS